MSLSATPSVAEGGNIVYTAGPLGDQPRTADPDLTAADARADFERIVAGDQALAQIHLHMALLNQARTNTARTKALRKQNILQLHKGVIVNAGSDAC